LMIDSSLENIGEKSTYQINLHECMAVDVGQ
jgi:hypothetical protein